MLAAAATLGCVASLPGASQLTALMRLQVETLAALPEALAALPGTLAALNRTIRTLDGLAGDARDAVAAVSRLAARVEAVVDQLEEPVLLLAPGLRRAAVVLSDPVIETVPDTLRQVRAEALPLLSTVVDTQAAVAGIAASTDRLMAVMDDVGGRLAGLPGIGRLGARAARRPEPPSGE